MVKVEKIARKKPIILCCTLKVSPEQYREIRQVLNCAITRDRRVVTNEKFGEPYNYKGRQYTKGLPERHWFKTDTADYKNNFPFRLNNEEIIKLITAIKNIPEDRINLVGPIETPADPGQGSSYSSWPFLEKIFDYNNDSNTETSKRIGMKALRKWIKFICTHKVFYQESLFADTKKSRQAANMLSDNPGTYAGREFHVFKGPIDVLLRYLGMGREWPLKLHNEEEERFKKQNDRAAGTLGRISGLTEDKISGDEVYIKVLLDLDNPEDYLDVASIHRDSDSREMTIKKETPEHIKQRVAQRQVDMGRKFGSDGKRLTQHLEDVDKNMTEEEFLQNTAAMDPNSPVESRMRPWGINRDKLAKKKAKLQKKYSKEIEEAAAKRAEEEAE